MYFKYKVYTILYIQHYIAEEVKCYSMILLKNIHVVTTLLLVSHFVRSSDDNLFYRKLYKHLTNLRNIFCTELY